MLQLAAIFHGQSLVVRKKWQFFVGYSLYLFSIYNKKLKDETTYPVGWGCFWGVSTGVLGLCSCLHSARGVLDLAAPKIDAAIVKVLKGQLSSVQNPWWL